MVYLYEEIAQCFLSMLSCREGGNTEWEYRHRERINNLVNEWFPSGSGYDNGTDFSFDDSRPDRIVFNTSYHHMNEGGYYTGWTEHQVVVRPALVGKFTLSITGRNRNDIKNMIADHFHTALLTRLLTPKENAKEALGIPIWIPDLVAADLAQERKLMNLDQVLREKPYEIPVC